MLASPTRVVCLVYYFETRLSLLLCSWYSVPLIDHPTIWLTIVLGCFMLNWLEKALMPAVIVVNKGLLEREFDCVGGRFILRIDPSEDSHKSVLIL